MLFFVWSVSKMFEKVEVKQSVVIQVVKVMHTLLYQ